MGLSVRNLRISFDDLAVLRNISAQFPKGRITAIIGPNGAGKSTFLKALASLLPAANESISLDENYLASLSFRERARKIGYLAQDITLAWDIYVEDVVALGRYAHAPNAKTDAKAMQAAMDQTDTQKFKGRLTGSLSGGEMARVLLARILAGQPEWILADEPLASLDPAYQISFMDRLREVAAAGTGILIVLHDLNIAARLADDVLMLKEGDVFAHGPVAETMTADALTGLYNVPISALSGAKGKAAFQIG